MVLAACVVACGGRTNAPAAVVPNSAQHEVAPPPSGTPRGGPSPKEHLSQQLGGMRLGMTADEFSAACKGGGGALVRASEIDLVCSAAPSPLKFPGRQRVELGGQIAGKFCRPDATACELTYLFEGDGGHRDEQTNALVEMLVEKYGPPATSEGHAGNDPMGRCTKDKSVQFARVWLFSPDQSPPHPVGAARLVFECDLRVTADTHRLRLVYEDESAVAYRQREAAMKPPSNY